MSTAPTRADTRLKLWLALALLAAALTAPLFFDVKSWLQNALHWIDQLGRWAPAAFIGLYILACVLFVPGWILTLGAGVLFGVAYGSIYVSSGATVGATCAFLVGRYFARDWVAKRFEGNPKFKAIDAAVAREGWKIVGLVRLSPIFPFNLVNYAFGLTRVSLRDYVLASWLGMLPGTVMYVYIGSLVKNLAELGAGKRERTAAEWALYAVGLLATVAVTIYITHVAKKALAPKIAA